MIKHVVMWRLKEENREQNAKKAKEVLESLVGKIGGLLSLEVGINSYVDKNPNADCVLISTHTDFAALEQYQTHPEHQKAVDFIKKIVESRGCVDFISKDS